LFPPRRHATIVIDATRAPRIKEDEMAGLDVTALFEARGDGHYGEAVTQRDHALQCAALASRAGGDDELVLAALLHDLAHLAVPEGRETAERHHGHHGAALVAPFVPARVAWIIEHHVAAKRYLCAVDPIYLERLSPASVHSLAVQGGPLHREDAMALAAHPWFADALNVRRWDDEAKDPQAKTPPLSAWVPLLERYFGPQTLRRA